MKLIETRRNHAVYQPDDYYDEIKALYKKYGDKLFATYTRIPKLGIYPASGYNTPLGIYSYPIQYIIDHTLSVPYPSGAGANSPYFLQLFYYKGNRDILYLNKEKLQTQLQKYYILTH